MQISHDTISIRGEWGVHFNVSFLITGKRGEGVVWGEKDHMIF